MAAGSSERGLSSVTKATSASRCGRLAHQGPLAAVAVAAGAEDHDQPAARVRAKGLKHVSSHPAYGRNRQRLPPRWPGPHTLQATGRALECSSAASASSGASPAAMQRPAATSALPAERPGQGQQHLEGSAVRGDGRMLALGVGAALEEAQGLTVFAHRQHGVSVAMLAGRRRLQILDDDRLFAALADHREHVTRRAAVRVVVRW